MVDWSTRSGSEDGRVHILDLDLDNVHSSTGPHQ